MTTLYTAKKYAVPALEKNCVDYLKVAKFLYDYWSNIFLDSFILRVTKI